MKTFRKIILVVYFLVVVTALINFIFFDFTSTTLLCVTISMVVLVILFGISYKF